MVTSCSGQSVQPDITKRTVDFNTVWPSGLSASAPFEGAEPRDLTAHIGYIQPFPNQMKTAMGVDQIFILLPRSDITGGSGHLTLSREGTSSEVKQVAFDSQAVQFLPMTKQELSDMGWEVGTKVLITFEKLLKPGSYAVEMEEGCILAPDFGVKSPAYANVWSFQVSEYGMADMECSSGDRRNAKVGDTVTLHIVLGGEAVKSRVEITPEDAATAAAYELSEDGTCQITFVRPGTIMYSLFFYNAQGEEIGILDHSITVTQ